MSVMTPQWLPDASPTQSAVICLHISCVGASLALRVTVKSPAEVSFTLFLILIDTPIKGPLSDLIYVLFTRIEF